MSAGPPRPCVALGEGWRLWTPSRRGPVLLSLAENRAKTLWGNPGRSRSPAGSSACRCWTGRLQPPARPGTHGAVGGSTSPWGGGQGLPRGCGGGPTGGLPSPRRAGLPAAAPRAGLAPRRAVRGAGQGGTLPAPQEPAGAHPGGVSPWAHGVCRGLLCSTLGRGLLAHRHSGDGDLGGVGVSGRGVQQSPGVVLGSGLPPRRGQGGQRPHPSQGGRFPPRAPHRAGPRCPHALPPGARWLPAAASSSCCCCPAWPRPRLARPAAGSGLPPRGWTWVRGRPGPRSWGLGKRQVAALLAGPSLRRPRGGQWERSRGTAGWATLAEHGAACLWPARARSALQ